jgi:hypothetical protein
MINRILLRAMLASLAVAAVVGAGSILFGRSEVAWRIIGTMVTLSIACLLMLAVSRKLNSATARSAAIAAAGVIVAEFILALGEIWDIFDSFSHDWIGWELMGVIAIAGASLIVSLALRTRPSSRTAGRAGIVLSAIVFLIYLAAIYTDADACWIYANASLGFGALACVGLIGVGIDRWHWRWIGIAAAIGGLALVWIATYTGAHSDNPEPIVASLSLAIVVAHANIALRTRLKPSQKWLGYTTVAAVVICAAAFNFDALTARRWSSIQSDTSGMRIAAACAILAACGSLALIVITQLNRRQLRPRTAFDAGTIHATVVCPVCSRNQPLTAGRGECERCGLRFVLSAEEPKCPACGYSLLYAKSDRCPECGLDVGSKVLPV